MHIASLDFSMPAHIRAILTKQQQLYKQEAHLSQKDRGTRACQLNSCKLRHKCRWLAFEKIPETGKWLSSFKVTGHICCSIHVHISDWISVVFPKSELEWCQIGLAKVSFCVIQSHWRLCHLVGHFLLVFHCTCCKYVFIFYRFRDIHT